MLTVGVAFLHPLAFNNWYLEWRLKYALPSFCPLFDLYNILHCAHLILILSYILQTETYWSYCTAGWGLVNTWFYLCMEVLYIQANSYSELSFDFAVCFQNLLTQPLHQRCSETCLPILGLRRPSSQKQILPSLTMLGR